MRRGAEVTSTYPRNVLVAAWVTDLPVKEQKMVISPIPPGADR